MPPRQRHAKKDIESALQAAEAKGFRVKKSEGGRAHAWGRLICPVQGEEHRAHQMSIPSTPKSPSAAARRILHFVDKWQHCIEGSEES